MSKDALLKWLPYVLAYVLIFRDPYSTLIPVREPTLVYSPETTWLLEGTTPETDFAAAYNRRFADLLQDERNAFAYFVKAVDDVGLTPAARKTLGSIQARGENAFCIPPPRPGSLVWKRLAEANKGKEDFPDFLEDRSQENVFAIIDRIDLPANVDRYEEPLFSDVQDKSLFALLMGRYVLNLARYGQDRKGLGKALAQLRLLSHTFDADRLKRSVAAYRHLVRQGPAKPEEIRRIEQDLPPWPNARTLVGRLQRAFTTDYLSSPSRHLDELVAQVRKKDRDFCLDRNEVLRTVHRYFLDLERLLPDRPLDQACGLQSAIESVATAVGDRAEKRPLAERMLFSGSVAQRHRRAAQHIGGVFCLEQARRLCEVLDVLAEIRRDLEKPGAADAASAAEGHGPSVPSSAATTDDPHAKDTKNHGP